MCGRCRGLLRVGLAHVFGSEKAGLGILVAVLLRATILCGFILSDDLRQVAVVVRGSLQLIRLVLPPATRQEVKVPVNGRMAIIWSKLCLPSAPCREERAVSNDGVGS